MVVQRLLSITFSTAVCCMLFTMRRNCKLCNRTRIRFREKTKRSFVVIYWPLCVYSFVILLLSVCLIRSVNCLFIFFSLHITVVVVFHSNVASFFHSMALFPLVFTAKLELLLGANQNSKFPIERNKRKKKNRLYEKSTTPMCQSI